MHGGGCNRVFGVFVGGVNNASGDLRNRSSRPLLRAKTCPFLTGKSAA